MEGIKEHLAEEIKKMWVCVPGVTNHCWLAETGHVSFQNIEDEPGEAALIKLLMSTPNEVRLERFSKIAACAGKYYRSVIDEKDDCAGRSRFHKPRS